MTARAPRWGARGSRASVSGGGGGPEPVAAEPGAARAAAGPSAARATKARRVKLGIRYPPYLPLLAFGREGLRPGRYHGRPRVPIGARPRGPSIPARGGGSHAPTCFPTGRLRPRRGLPISRPGPPRHRPRMPTSTRKPSPYGFTGSAELNAMIERVAPAVLELLA